MKKILGIIELTSLIGVILICLCIWFIGPHIPFEKLAFLASKGTRLAMIGSLFVVWCLTIFMYNVLSAYSREKIIKALVSDNEKTPIDSKRLQKNVLTLINAFKRRPFEFFDTRAHTPLIHLFILIGPSSSGKTMLLTKSDLLGTSLDLDTQKARADLAQMKAGTWWSTHDSLFVEINTETDSLQALRAALFVFRRHRFYHLFHGIIVTQAMDQLMNQSEEQTINDAASLNVYLRALYDILKIHAPLYLMFTKMDTVSGFNDYFNKVSYETRELPFGYIIHAQNPSIIHAIIDRTHHRFTTHLQRDVLHRLFANDTPSTIGRIFNFSQQMQVCKQAIQTYSKTLFNTEKSENPYTLYGHYFSSAITDAKSPIDYYRTSMQNILTFAHLNQEVYPSSHESKTYFVKGFLKHHISAGTHFIINKQPQHIIRSFIRQLSIAIGGVFIGLYVLFASLSLIKINNHTSYLNALLHTYYYQHNKDLPLENTLTDALPHLDPLRQMCEYSPPYSIGYKPFVHTIFNTLNQTVDQTLSHALAVYYLPLLVKRLEWLLTQENEPNNTLVMRLKAYLSFSRSPYDDHATLHTILANDIKSTYENDQETADKLLWYLKKTETIAFPTFPLNWNLVHTKQDILKHSNPLTRIYAQLKEYADQQTPRFFIPVNAWSPYFREVFDENQTFIPVFYTTTGYTTLFKAKQNDFMKNIFLDDDRIGISTTNSSIRRTKDNLTQELHDLYTHDYLTQWHDFLSSLVIIPTNSLEELTQLITRLSGKEELLLKIITDVSLEVTPLVTASTDPKFKELSHFVALIKTERLPELQAIITQLGQLATSLKALLHAQDLGKACFLYTKKQQDATRNPLHMLSQTAQTLPLPLKKWVDEIVKRTDFFVIKETVSHIDKLWMATIYDVYEKSCAHSYPFVKTAPHEVEWNTLKSLFGAHGTLETFFNTYLKELSELSTTYTEPNIDITPDTKPNPFEKYTRIFDTLRAFRTQFFDDKDNVIIPFQIESFTMDSTFSSLSFTYGETFVYRHGPTQRKKFNWSSADNDSNTCAVLGVDFDQHEESISVDGLWSLFRLIDTCTVKPDADEKRYLLTLPFKKSAQIVLISPKLIHFLTRSRELNSDILESSITPIHHPQKQQ